MSVAMENSSETTTINGSQEAALSRGDFLDMFKVMQAQISETVELTVQVVRDPKDDTNDGDRCYKYKKTGKPVIFKFKGNEEQYYFNLEILEMIELAQYTLSHDKKGDCEEILHDLFKSVKHRNKLIRLADRSEAGWDFVRQYERV